MTPEEACRLVPAANPLAEKKAHDTRPLGPVTLSVRDGAATTEIRSLDLSESWVVHVTEDWEIEPFRGTDLTALYVVMVGRMLPDDEGDLYRVMTSDYRRNALSSLIADHPMWEGVEYTQEREAAIAEFVEQVLAL